MTAVIRTSELPADVQPGHLIQRCRAETGTIAIIARPGGKNAVAPLIRDIVTATSDNNQPTQMPKAESRLTNIAIARLIGYGIRHVVVCAAENLPTDCLITLNEIVITAGADLTLLYGYDTGEGVRTWGEEQAAADVEWDSIEPLLPPPTRNNADSGSRPLFPEEVPWVDFPLYRATCRRLLSPEDFETVDGLYRDTFRTVRDAHSATTDDASSLLQHLLQQTHQPAETITILRATQAALLTQGQLLKVDLRHLYLVTAQGHHQRLDDSSLRLLTNETEPHIAAIAALTDAGLTTDAIHTLRIRDITPEGDLPDSPQPLLPEARNLIATQRHYRLLEGHNPDDPLIHPERRTIPNALRRAALHGIPVDISRTQTAKPDRWQHRTGIHLKDLT